MDLPRLVAFVAAHERPHLDDLHHWITTHMYISGVYYGIMATVCLSQPDWTSTCSVFVPAHSRTAFVADARA